ncbi:MAG: YfhO family protein [Rhodospirillales bacterium]|nr:YfhO family protein [Rhodospirillales bacterium]
MIRLSRQLRLSRQQVILAILILWTGAEFIFLGKYAPPAGTDNLISSMSNLQTYARSGQWTLGWMPHVAGGVDTAAQGFYPVITRIAFFSLPNWLAGYLLSLGPIVAGVLGVYLLCRRLGLVFAAAAFAAFVWVIDFGDTMFLKTAVPGYLPLFIASLTYLLDDRKSIKRWLAALGMLVVLGGTGYFSRILPFPLIIMGVWFLLIEPRRGISNWLIIGLMTLLVIAMRTPEIIAMANNAPLAPISDFRQSDGLIEIMGKTARGLGEVFVGGPKNYTTAICFALFGYSLLDCKNRQRNRFMIVAIVTATVLPFLMAAGKIAIQEFLPFLSGFNINNYFNSFRMLIVVSGAIGFAALIENVQKGTISRWAPRAIGGVLLIFSLTLKANAAYEWITQGSLKNNYESPVLNTLAGKIKTNGRPVRALAHQMYGPVLHAYGIETLGGANPLLMRRYHNFWQKMSEGWRSRASFDLRRGGDRGAQISYLPAGDNIEWPIGDDLNMKMLSLANVGYVVSRDHILAPGLKQLSGPDRPWHALSRNEKIKVNLHDNFSGRNHVFVYKNANVFPRFYTVTALRTFDNGEKVLDAVAAASLGELASTLFTEKGLIPKRINPNTPLYKSGVQVDRYDNNEIVLTIKSKGTTALIATNAYSPFWKATVDGVPTIMFPADHAFWGVFLPAGAKKVVFRYQPPYPAF